MAFVRGLGRTFLLIGFTMLLFVAYELVGTSAITNGHQSTLAQEFDDARRVSGAPVVIGPKTATPAPKPVPKPRLGRSVARIKIPKIGVNAIVVEGARVSDLARGPGHYPLTPLPWEPGTTGIAGHRTGWGQPFYDLDELVAGDIVELETLRGTFRYRVTRKIVVNPEDSWVLGGNPDSDAEAQLALTTCTPKYTSRDRLIVWADRLQEKPR